MSQISNSVSLAIYSTDQKQSSENQELKKKQSAVSLLLSLYQITGSSGDAESSGRRLILSGNHKHFIDNKMKKEKSYDY